MQNDLQQRFTNLKNKVEQYKRDKIVYETELKQLTTQQDTLEREVMTLTETESFPEALEKKILIEAKLSELMEAAEAELGKLL